MQHLKSDLILNIRNGRLRFTGFAQSYFFWPSSWAARSITRKNCNIDSDFAVILFLNDKKLREKQHSGLHKIKLQVLCYRKGIKSRRRKQKLKEYDMQGLFLVHDSATRKSYKCLFTPFKTSQWTNWQSCLKTWWNLKMLTDLCSEKNGLIQLPFTKRIYLSSHLFPFFVCLCFSVRCSAATAPFDERSRCANLTWSAIESVFCVLCACYGWQVQ